MFGIDDMLIWGPMLGAAAGALTKKKDPLQGALMGGLLGYGGALAAPTLLGSGTAATAMGEGALGSGIAAGTTETAAGLGSGLQGGILGAGESGVNASLNLGLKGLETTAAGTPAQIAAANPSMLDQAMSVAKPVGQIAGTVSAVKSLTPQDKPLQIMPSPISQAPQTGPQGLAQLAQANRTVPEYIRQQNEAEQRKRLALIAKMGGNYGLA